MGIRMAAQSAPSVRQAVVERQGHLDVAITYDATEATAIRGSSFWMQGGSVQAHGQFLHGLGVVAEISGAHVGNINSSGLALNLITATFGPRYTWSPAHRRYSLFGQLLGGEGFGFNGLFPDSSGGSDNANTYAIKSGGGVSVSLSRHVAVRALEVNWLRTALPNGITNVQDNVQFGTGIVFRAGRH
ncbi:MAG: hypothetical protein WBQ94_15495 [Terracidiphilus sp.]